MKHSGIWLAAEVLFVALVAGIFALTLNVTLGSMSSELDEVNGKFNPNATLDPSQMEIRP
jgi:hypothetical protein